MKKFAVIANRTKESAIPAAKKVCEFLKNLGATVIAPKRDADIVPADEYLTKSTGLYKKPDAAIIFGGDGTVLRYAADAAKAKLPMIGVNNGTLGYLTEIEVGEIELLKALYDDEYEIEERMMIDVHIESSAKNKITDYTALNEALILRNCNTRLLDFVLECDGSRAAAYHSDGLIIATPTGSSAYAMSAGGPLIDPKLACLSVCPVCAHTFAASRPILFAPDSVLKATVDCRSEGEIFIQCDGNTLCMAKPGDTVTVSRSKLSTKLITVKKNKFYNTVYEKFNAQRSI